MPCFFSCRVRDVCFFFFLAPAEWGWLTRQRSCSGRLGQGDSPEVKGDEGGGRLSCSPLTSCWWQNQLVPWQSSLFFVVAVVSLLRTEVLGLRESQPFLPNPLRGLTMSEATANR